MLLEHTIYQLDIGPVAPERAGAMGQLGYMQWLGGLPGNADYRHEARRALARAQPFCESSPAVAAFCELLCTSVAAPLRVLPLAMPAQCRRGGSKARRLSI